jgi:hypothetical protein
MANEAQAGMAWSQIAESAYRAYGVVTGNRNFRGDPMPEFADLPPKIRAAWEVAVRQAVLCADCKPGDAPSESLWAGFVPPQMRDEASRPQA